MNRRKLFIGGIMQGSHQVMSIHSQDYRQEIADIVRRHHPDVDIIDPFVLHPNSTSYDRTQAVQTFLELLNQAAAADILVAFLPQASMGTAVEMWRAFEAGKPVLVISPLINHWVLWATATHILPDMAAFEQFIADGGLRPYL